MIKYQFKVNVVIKSKVTRDDKRDDLMVVWPVVELKNESCEIVSLAVFSFKSTYYTLKLYKMLRREENPKHSRTSSTTAVETHTHLTHTSSAPLLQSSCID